MLHIFKYIVKYERRMLKWNKNISLFEIIILLPTFADLKYEIRILKCDEKSHLEKNNNILF